MRDTTGAASRKIARNSQPSTSADSNNSSNLEAHSSLRKRKKPRAPQCSPEFVTPVVPDTCQLNSSICTTSSESGRREIDDPTTSTSLRRSAREPRPKRTLSPTPLSPKRRSRAKGPCFIMTQSDDLKENDEWNTRKTEKTASFVTGKDIIYVPDSIDRSQISAGKETSCASYKSIHSVDIPEVAYETNVADEDIENDLVDIQLLESSDTTNEVFMSANLVSHVNLDQHVNVSVLTLPQLPENMEHSTENVIQPSKTFVGKPDLNSKDVSTASCAPTRISKDTSDPLDQLNVINGESTQRFMSEKSQSSSKLFDDCSHEITHSNSGGESCLMKDSVNQMEPPVLDGPIIVSPQCEMKSATEMPPTLTADGVVEKEGPKPMHYVVGEIYRVHTPNGTEQEVQLAVMDDGSEALVNANGEIVDMTPEDTYATIDICDIDFNFLDDKNIVCGLCGEVVLYTALFSGHLSRVHPEMLDADMIINGVPYVDYLKTKLENDRKNIRNGFKFSKQAMFRRTPRKVSQIRINPSEMSMPQLEIALKKKLLEKMGRRVSVSLVDKEHVKCGICNSVISINKKFEIVHVVRHFNAWHPTNHQCAGQWQKRTQKPGVGKPLSKQDFAVIDLSHTQPDNLQCIWCGMFIDATTIAVHFTECHPGEVEVPKCLLCIQELVINARLIEKFGSDFDVTLPDEFHIKVGKLNKLFTSESQMDIAIERYLDTLNGKRKRAPLTVERRVFDGDSVVVHTTAIPGEEDSVDDIDEIVSCPPRPTNTNSRQVFGRHNKPKRSMVQPIYRQAPPTNSDYVKVISESHWKCKICDADLYGAVISACAIRHFKLKHPQESDSLQFEVVRARLDRISDGCMEFVHPQMLECLICRLTYQLHKPYNVCRGIRHLKSRHPEIMPEFNGEPLRRYRKTGTALRLDDDPNIPRRRRDTQLHVNDDSDLLARMKAQYPGSFDKVQTIYGAAGEPMYVLMSESDETEEVIKENMKLISNASAPQHGKNKQRAEINGEHLALDEVKPRQEVVFELSYDYDNLDAHGKPRKHLVRVTPGVQNKLSLNSDSRPRYLVRNEGHSNTAAEVEQSEPNEVYFGDAEHGDENSTEESAVIFGDVLFIDADGNEIIQRTTALPDGTIQQQYLGQAEDGSLYVLSDIVSTGLHPYADSVEEVFEEMISDDVPQQELILDDYESHLNNIPSHRHQVNNHSGQSVETEVQQKDFDSKSSSLVAHTYNGGETIVVEEYCDEEDRLRQKYGREIVISGDARYDEDETVLNEEVFRSGSVVKQEELVYDADENTTKQQFDRNVSDGEQLSIVTPSTNVLPPSTTDINNRS